MDGYSATPRTLSGIAIVVVASAILAVIVALPSARTATSRIAVDGAISLSNQERQSVQALRGEWLGIVNRVVSPAVLPQASLEPIPVPGTFADVEYLTYRVAIHGLNRGENYALYVMDVTGNARVFANGEYLGALGPVDQRGGLLPGFVPRLFTDLPQSSQIELVFQVDNMSHARGGIWQDVYFGPREQVLRLHNRLRGVELFVVGAILLMALYHLILYWLNPADRSPLFFAVFSLMVALKTMLSGHQVFLYHFEITQQVPIIRVAFAAITLAVPVFLWYLQTLFPRSTAPGIPTVASYLAAAQLLLVGFLPFDLLQMQFHVWQALILLGFGYAGVVTVRAVRSHTPGSISLLAGLIFLFIFALNDILFDMHLIHTGYMLSAGLFGFLFSQAVVLAVRHHILFEEAQDLRHELESKVEARTRELQRMAREDSLTGLCNRRWGAELLKKEVQRFFRYRTTLSVILIDVDHFKSINDARGHQAGDEVLQSMSRLLRQTTRKTDSLCRWGGEEFLLILPETSEDRAVALGQNLLETLLASPVAISSGAPVQISFSAGVAGIDEAVQHDGRNPEEAEVAVMDGLLRSADLALYRAKELGRRRVLAYAGIVS